MDNIPIKLLLSVEREPNQVIAMETSHENNFIAVISGKVLIKD